MMMVDADNNLAMKDGPEDGLPCHAWSFTPQQQRCTLIKCGDCAHLQTTSRTYVLARIFANVRRISIEPEILRTALLLVVGCLHISLFLAYLLIHSNVVQLIIRPTHKPCYVPPRKIPFINPE